MMECGIIPILLEINVKNFGQIPSDRAVVGVSVHDVVHVTPPLPAGFGLGDGGPSFRTLDFRVGEEQVCLRVEEDRVIEDSVGSEDFLQLGPDGIVAPGVFGVLIGVYPHDEGFANHGEPLPGTSPEGKHITGIFTVEHPCLADRPWGSLCPWKKN